jgi:hypothetical protein
MRVFENPLNLQLKLRNLFMAKATKPDTTGDSKADAIAVISVLSIILVAVVYWLSRF